MPANVDAANAARNKNRRAGVVAAVKVYPLSAAGAGETICNARA
jgi:hypothetical protein